MIGILNFFFIILLIIIFMVVFVVVAVMGKVQGFIRQIRGHQNTGNTGSYNYSHSSSNYGEQGNERVSGSQPTQKKKIIPADEGEYVEFEEIP